MEASLCIHTCDKCGKPMRRNQEIVLVSKGWIRGPKRKDLITFWGANVKYAYHLSCWDDMEESA
jgi:hypothetical protein